MYLKRYIYFTTYTNTLNLFLFFNLCWSLFTGSECSVWMHWKGRVQLCCRRWPPGTTRGWPHPHQPTVEVALSGHTRNPQDRRYGCSHELDWHPLGQTRRRLCWICLRGWYAFVLFFSVWFCWNCSESHLPEVNAGIVGMDWPPGLDWIYQCNARIDAGDAVDIETLYPWLLDHCAAADPNTWPSVRSTAKV